MTKQQAEQLVAFEEKFNQAQPLYSISETPTIMPYLYSDEINDFIQFCYNNHLVNSEYKEIEKEWQENKTNAEWFANIGEEKLIQCIGYIIRTDRFCDGFIASVITSGVMKQLFKRVKMIHHL